MTAPTLLNLLPEHFLPPLKALGRYEWLVWQQRPGHVPRTEFRLRLPDAPEVRKQRWFFRALERMAAGGTALLLKMYAYSKLIVDGPKLLRPTAAQCEALEHVDVNLTFAEYEQPFPALLVELPEAYRRSLAERFGHPCARFVMVFHDRPSGYLLTSCEAGPDRGGTCSILSPRPRWATVEDALRFCPEPDGPDLRVGEVAYRVAINFALLLTRFGVKVCGPVSPEGAAAKRPRARRRKGRHVRRAGDLLAAALTQIDFEQDVLVCDSLVSSTPSPDALGGGKRSHWRRGHFRKQPCGSGRADRRLVFIRPCFVNAEAFQGDRAGTEYRIACRS